MTRDEAVSAIHQAHHPEDFRGIADCETASNRRWAEKAVDGYVALGILKLEEPKTPEAELQEALENEDDHYGLSTEQVLAAITRLGLKVVRA